MFADERVNATSTLRTDFLPLDPRLAWTVPRPPAATPCPVAAGLRVVPFAGADLWERTGPANGRSKTDGAALVAPVDGDRVVASVSLTLHAKHAWDQAGLFVRDAATEWWAKACVEAVPGGGFVLAVSITARGWTDQSTAPLPLAPGKGWPEHPVSVALQAAREGPSIAFYWADPAALKRAPAEWARLRLAPLVDGSGDGGDAPPSLEAGVYALAPEAAGCVAVFHSLAIGVPCAPEGGPDGARLGLCVRE